MFRLRRIVLLPRHHLGSCRATVTVTVTVTNHMRGSGDMSIIFPRPLLSPSSPWFFVAVALSTCATQAAWVTPPRHALAAACPCTLRQSSPFLLESSRTKRIATKTTTTRLFSTNQEQELEQTEDSYSTSYHAPVMWKECIDALLATDNLDDDNNNHDNSNTDSKPRLFIDGTLGGGGHSQALLQRCRPGDIVFGCDVDPDALATASQRLAAYITPSADDDRPLFVPVQANFCQLAAVLPTVLHPTTQQPILSSLSSATSSSTHYIDGILLDLGVSSFQIDTAERGFAFMKDGPLDMRMNGGSGSGGGPNDNKDNRGTLNAADICNEFDVKELTRILKVYGNEPRSKAIAQAIVQQRPLHTTADLVAAVSSVVPQFAKRGRRQGRTATLARVFQALRIVVNQEDVVLERALMEMAPSLLRPGGRLVILSYHSMEDRMAKRALRDGMVGIPRPADDERDLYGNYIGAPRPFRTAGKARKATDGEVEANPRARSATLRVGIRQQEKEQD